MTGYMVMIKKPATRKISVFSLQQRMRLVVGTKPILYHGTRKLLHHMVLFQRTMIYLPHAKK